MIECFKFKEFITLDRCFWEKRTTKMTIYKNDEILEHISITLTVRPHQIVPYGF
jgi:hypothetical protein